MEHRLSLVTLGVRDVAEAARFYTSVGFEHARDLGSIVFLPTTGPVLALYGWDDLAADTGLAPEGAGFRGVTLAVNLDSMEEVDALYARWTEAGATVVRVPEDKEWGGYSGYLSDPDGHLWEIAFNPSFQVLRIDAEGRMRLAPEF